MGGMSRKGNGERRTVKEWATASRSACTKRRRVATESSLGPFGPMKAALGAKTGTALTFSVVKPAVAIEGRDRPDQHALP